MGVITCMGNKTNLNFKQKRHQNNNNCSETPIQKDIDCWNITTIEEEKEKHLTLNGRFLLLHIILCVHTVVENSSRSINKSCNTIQNLGIKSYHIMSTIGNV